MNAVKDLQIAQDEQKYIEQLATQAKNASIQLRAVSTAKKNEALRHLAEFLDTRRNEIMGENAQDVENAHVGGLAPALIDRLVISDKVVDSMVKSLVEIAALQDPVGKVVDGWVLPNGLQVRKTRIPIGVIAIVYESRPNVTIDVGALGLKSSNAVILRGGKEALHSNKILAGYFHKAIVKAGLPASAVQLLDKTNRGLMAHMLTMKNHIDLVVPRGGSALIEFVSQNSLIPVVKHDKGVCHVYLHATAKKEIALPVLLNSKTQRPEVCNAAECVLLDRELPYLADVLHSLIAAGVKLHGDSLTREALSDFPVEALLEEGYQTEYLDMRMSVKVVNDLDHALTHIQTNSSSHTEAIIAEDYATIQKFLNSLDSAALMVNSSTRFHDGGQFGLGAEVGISTGKLHSRGPMGLTDLTTTKYIVEGSGQIRT